MGLVRGLWVSLSFLLLLSLRAEEPQDVEKEVSRQIHLLNSDRIEERQDAMETLIRIGIPALPALRDIVANGPLEVRSRARGLITRIEWGLSATAPAELARIAENYENSDTEERVKILLRLAKNPDADYRAVFDRAWAALDDPEASVRLAADLMKWNTALVEEVLRRQAREGDHRVLRTLGEVLILRGDFDKASEAFRRAYEKAPEESLEKRWGEALFLAHRDRHLAQGVVEGKFHGIGFAHRVEALYRGGRREKAGELLARATDGSHAMLPYRYRDPRASLSVIEAVGSRPEELRVQAHLEAKDFEGAEKAFRSLKEIKSRVKVASELFLARGDTGLLGPRFLQEASLGGKEAAKHHLRLGEMLEGEDPVAALIEKKKAHFLDPDLLEAPMGAAPGAGVWLKGEPIGAYHWLPATKPVSIDNAYYFMNREGHLVKSFDLKGGRPEWISKTPRRGRIYFRGWQFEWYNQEPQIARWKDSLVVLLDRGRHTHSKEGTGEGGGMRLFLVDPETAEETWARSFPDLGSGYLFPAEGVVVFASGGLALFDLEKRTFRWAVGGLKDWPKCVWMERGSVYAGTGSGALLKLNAEDGSLVWRRKVESRRGGASYLTRVGKRLIWSPDGSTIVAVSPETGDFEWETRSRMPQGTKYLREKDTLFIATSLPFAATAVSLKDGRILWTRLISRRSAWGVFTLTPRGLVVSDAREFVLLEPESGKVRVAMAWPIWGASAFGSGTTLYPFDGELYVSGASAFDVQVELDSPYNPEMKTGFFRVVVRPAPPPRESSVLRTLAKKEKDVASRVSLLETACSTSDGRDTLTWAALAEAYAESGDFASASWAVRSSLLLQPYSVEPIRTWQKRVKAWKDPTGKDRALRNLQAQLANRAMPGETVEQVLAGEFPDRTLSYADRMITDLLHHPDPTVRRHTAIALARAGDNDGFRVLLEALEKAEPDVAVKAAGALARLFVDLRHNIASGWGGPEWRWQDELGTVRRALARKEPEVRGAVYALLHLIDPSIRGATKEADLRVALEAGDPFAQLASAAVLAAVGDQPAREKVARGIGHPRDEISEMAIWFAGWLRLEEVEKELLRSFEKTEARVLEALARIGTPSAWKSFVSKDSFYFTTGKALALGKRGTPEDVRELKKMVENERSFSTARSGFWGLREVNRSEARKLLIRFGESILKIDPEKGFWRMAVIRALLAEKRWNDAEEHLKVLEGQWPPIAPLKESRYRLLTGQGRDADARRLRKEAEAGYLHQANLEPRRGSHLFKAGSLFLDPKRLADRNVAEKHIEEAIGREPWNTHYKAALKQN